LALGAFADKGDLPCNREVFKACLKGVSVPEIEEIKETVNRLLAEGLLQKSKKWMNLRR
jgi:hypothetical protein